MALLRDGGFPMIVVLALGLLTVGTAAHAAWRRDAERLDLVRALSWATTFSVLAGFAAALGAVFKHVPARFGSDPKLHLVLLEGLGEAMAAPIVGFALLGAAWLFVAVAVRSFRAPQAG